MDKSMVKGVLLGGVAAIALAAGGVTGYKAINKPVYADVLAVKEVTDTVKTPREECHEVQVSRRAPVQDQRQIAGTVAGGVIGGLLGNTIGSGSGRTLATVAGAAAGGYAGNRVQKGMQDKDVTTGTETRCKTVYDTRVESLGYDVTYRLNGKEDVARLSYKPGPQIPVKDGKLAPTPPEDKQ